MDYDAPVSASNSNPTTGHAYCFATTHWSSLLAAKQGDSTEAAFDQRLTDKTLFSSAQEVLQPARVSKIAALRAFLEARQLERQLLEKKARVDSADEKESRIGIEHEM